MVPTEEIVVLEVVKAEAVEFEKASDTNTVIMIKAQSSRIRILFMFLPLFQIEILLVVGLQV
jgi:hypothetical protein